MVRFKLIFRLEARTDGQWGTDRREKGNQVLRLYHKTRWFWIVLVFVDLVAQACKTANSDQSTLNLLRRSLTSIQVVADEIGNLELAFTLAFDLETIVRFIGYLPDWKGFFTSGYHNSFDLLLAVVTTIIQIPPIPSSTVHDWLTIFQLMRWYRFVMEVPRMRPLLVGPTIGAWLTCRQWYLDLSAVCSTWSYF